MQYSCQAAARGASATGTALSAREVGYAQNASPRRAADPERLLLEQKILVWYDFFFSKGTRIVLQRALQVINQTLKQRQKKYVERLNGTTSPHVRQLNRAFRFRLCPDCIAETRLLQRMVLLPHIMFCPIHHVAFLRTCQRGAVLEAFHRQTLPFVCYVCGLDWAHLPPVRPTPEREKLELKLLSYYDFFFTQGTPELLLSALQLIREKLKKEKMARVKLLDGKIKQIKHYELMKASLGYLVELLTSLDLPFPISFLVSISS